VPVADVDLGVVGGVGGRTGQPLTPVVVGVDVEHDEAAVALLALAQHPLEGGVERVEAESIGSVPPAPAAR
jgi:hypothetical protein